MLNSCAQSAQKQADIDRVNHKQYLPDIIYINYIPKVHRNKFLESMSL